MEYQELAALTVVVFLMAALEWFMTERQSRPRKGR